MDTVACPSCGEENPAKFRLCGFCGTPLAAGTAGGGSVGTRAAAPASGGAASPAAGVHPPGERAPRDGVSLAGTAGGDASPFGSLLAAAEKLPEKRPLVRRQADVDAVMVAEVDR